MRRLPAVEVLQHDEEDWQDRRECYVELLFDSGATLRLPVGDEGFVYNNPDEGDEEDEDDEAQS